MAAPPPGPPQGGSIRPPVRGCPGAPRGLDCSLTPVPGGSRTEGWGAQDWSLSPPVPDPPIRPGGGVQALESGSHRLDPSRLLATPGRRSRSPKPGEGGAPGHTAQESRPLERRGRRPTSLDSEAELPASAPAQPSARPVDATPGLVPGGKGRLTVPPGGSAPPRESPAGQDPSPRLGSGWCPSQRWTTLVIAAEMRYLGSVARSSQVPWRAAPRNGPRDLSCTLGRPRSCHVTWARPQPPSRRARWRRVTHAERHRQVGRVRRRAPVVSKLRPLSQERRRRREAESGVDRESHSTPATSRLRVEYERGTRAQPTSAHPSVGRNDTPGGGRGGEHGSRRGAVSLLTRHEPRATVRRRRAGPTCAAPIPGCGAAHASGRNAVLSSELSTLSVGDRPPVGWERSVTPRPHVRSLTPW